MITENNWLQSNICELKTDRNIPDIICEYEPSNFKPSTFREAAIITAYRIKQKYKHIYVAYSGGADSEFILDRLHEIGANPKPVFVDVYYSHAQLDQVKKHCKELGIDPIIISIVDRHVAKEYETLIKNHYNFIPGMFNLFFYLLIINHVKQIYSDAILVVGNPAWTDKDFPERDEFAAVDLSPDLFRDFSKAILPFLYYTPQLAYEMYATIEKFDEGNCKKVKAKLYDIPYPFKKHKNIIKKGSDGDRISTSEEVPALWGYIDGKIYLKSALFKRKGSDDVPDKITNIWKNFKGE